jgi:hypothetical protein
MLGSDGFLPIASSWKDKILYYLYLYLYRTSSHFTLVLPL